MLMRCVINLPLKFSFCPIVFCSVDCFFFMCKLEYLLQIFFVIKDVIIFVIDMFLFFFF